MSGVANFDSLHKIAHYLAMIATAPFVFDSKLYQPPTTLKISPTFWRDYTCPPLCGGCCRAWTIDFWPWQWVTFKATYANAAKHFRSYMLIVNDSDYLIHSNRHSARGRFAQRQFCQFLQPADGRCSIHDYSPFSCRFELNRLQFFPERETAILGKKLYRNGWRFARIDDGVGARCEMVAVSDETIAIVEARDIPLLVELCDLATRLQIEHRGDRLLTLLRQRAGLEAMEIVP